MAGGYYVLIRFVIIFLDAISIAMLVRVVLSWLRMGEGQSPIGNFVLVITEPFIMPIRALFYRLNWFQDGPLDMAFLVTALLLSFVNMLLSGMVA